jgi:hypothetical protein
MQFSSIGPAIRVGIATVTSGKPDDKVTPNLTTRCGVKAFARENGLQ